MKHSFLLILLVLFAQQVFSVAPVCDRIFLPQIKNQKSCPFPPKRKNGRNCFAAQVIDLDRHAEGYKDYILDKVQEAVEMTKQYSLKGVDLTLLMSILAKESWYNPTTTNQWGDIGISQFQPATAQATVDYMRELNIPVPEEVTTKLPPKCKKTKYSTPLSAACFQSIQEVCETPEYSNSLFCPHFALKLMAFHFLQIKERSVIVEYEGASHNLSLILNPPGDEEADIRYTASIYNRGFRIYNSAFHYFAKNSKWLTAKDYGPLWNVERKISRDNDPFAGGTLYKHYINRCYVWAIGGLCGGLKESVIESYSKLLCPNRQPILSFASVSQFQEEYEKEKVPKTWSDLVEISKASHSTDLSKHLDLAFSLYETQLEITNKDLLELLNSFYLQSSSNKKKNFVESYLLTVQKISIVNDLNIFLEEIDQAKEIASAEKFITMRVLRAEARRHWLKTQNLEWLFATGLAGFYFYQSGEFDLRQYLKECKNTQYECRNTDQAKKLIHSLSKMDHTTGR